MMALSLCGRGACRGTAAAVVLAVGMGVTSSDPGGSGQGPQGPTFQLTWSINDGPLNMLLPAGISLGDGSFEYTGETLDLSTGLVLGYDFTCDPAGLIDGTLDINNELTQPIDVTADVRLATALAPAQESVLVGVAVVGLTTTAGGGSVQSVPPQLYETVVDGNVLGPATALFHHPFEVTHTGFGSSQTYEDFGVPEPVPGPPVLDTLGFNVRFSVTGLDIVAVSTLVGAAPVNLLCAADLTGDNQVGVEDFSAILNAWGPCDGLCPADLTGNGSVGVDDMLMVMAGWGSCP